MPAVKLKRTATSSSGIPTIERPNRHTPKKKRIRIEKAIIIPSRIEMTGMSTSVNRQRGRFSV